MNGTTATISEKSPRAERWQRVFQRLTDIPLLSPLSIRVSVPEKGTTDAYLLDLDMLKPDERERLIQDIASRFDIPLEEVRRDIVRGVPILAEDLIVSIPQGLALSMMADDEEIHGRDFRDEEDEDLCDGEDEPD